MNSALSGSVCFCAWLMACNPPRAPSAAPGHTLPPAPPVAADPCANAGLNDDTTYCYTKAENGQLLVAIPFGLLFQLEDNLHLCRTVFDGEPFFDPLMRVGAWGTTLSADEMRRSYENPQPAAYIEQPGITWKEFLWEGMTRGMLWKIFNGVQSWTHLNIDVGDASTVVHAEIKPAGDPEGRYARIIMYGTSCAPAKIYGINISEFDRMSRYMFIAAHELGHLMDYYAGDTAALGTSSPEIERRATLYGSYLMECWLRILVRDFGDAPGEFGPMASRLPTELRPVSAPSQLFKSSMDQRCAVKKWQALLSQMAALRSKVAAAQFASSLSGVAQCRSPR